MAVALASTGGTVGGMVGAAIGCPACCRNGCAVDCCVIGAGTLKREQCTCATARVQSTALLGHVTYNMCSNSYWSTVAGWLAGWLAGE